MNNRRAGLPYLLGAMLLIAGIAVTSPSAAHAATTILVPADHPTIQEAIDAAVTGDEILVAPGLYTEYLDFGGKDIAVTSMAGTGVTRIFAPDWDGGYRSTVMMGPGGSLSGFTVSAQRRTDPGVEVFGAGSLIEGNIFRGDIADGLYQAVAGVDASPTVTGNYITGLSCPRDRGAIDLDGQTAAIVSNNVVVANGSCTGIRLGLTQPGTLVINNTVVGHPDYGIYLHGSSGAFVRNNIVVGSWRGFTIRLGPAAALSNNLVWDNDNPYVGVDDPTGADGNISGDPLFTGTGLTPYATGAGSPAIDAGTATDAPAISIDGAPRPLDGDASSTAEFDIGAYEAGLVRATITGSVVSPASVGIGGACVVFYDGVAAVDGVLTEVDGTFEAVIDPGTYDVEFSDCGAGVYPSKWHDNSADQSGATPVVTVAGTTQALAGAMLDNPMVLCRGEAPTQWGTETRDVISGGPDRDVLLGFGGKDSLKGGDGDDVVCGGDGDDMLYGDDGDDLLFGGAGKDYLFGRAGHDTLLGGSGNDWLYGENGSDLLKGGKGNDRLNGHKGDNALDGGEGTDRINFNTLRRPVDVDLPAGTGAHGSSSMDTIVDVENVTGTNRGDTIIGTDGPNKIDSGSGDHDYVDGGGGDDVIVADSGTLIGGTGDDELTGGYLLVGGPGNDVLKEGQIVMPGSGNDKAYGQIISYADATGPVEVDLRNGRATGSGNDKVGARHVIGSDFDDILIGNGLKNEIKGRAGDDTILGLGFGDTIYGGGGNDTIDGGGEDDIIYGGSGNDVIEGGDGMDKLWGGSGDDEIAGGPMIDRIHGDGGDDVIDGGNHRDKLWGGRGDDIINGGKAADKIYGEGGSDVLSGGSGDDVIEGSTGADTLNGGDGDDELIGAGGPDILNGGLGHDVLVGGSKRDTLNGDEGDDVLDGGTGKDTLNGGADQDLLIGGDGRDNLRGDGGHDTLAGVAGDDRLNGGSGIDTASFALSPAGVDVNLPAGTASGEGSDTLIALEWIVGSTNNDTLVGTSGTNLIEARAGDDVLWGGSDDDYLIGNEGDDDLRGEAGTDILDGGDGTDSLNGGSGADTCVAGETHVSCEDIQADGLLELARGSAHWRVPGRWQGLFGAV